MRITICGSLKFIDMMKELKFQLEQQGHEVQLPEKVGGTNYDEKPVYRGAENIAKYDLIRKHNNHIIKSDAIIVLNLDKKGVVNYIGGNAFLEMGFAHVNNKKIFVLNPLPTGLNYEEELIGMNPVILNGDLALVK